MFQTCQYQFGDMVIDQCPLSGFGGKRKWEEQEEYRCGRGCVSEAIMQEAVAGRRWRVGPLAEIVTGIRWR